MRVAEVETRLAFVRAFGRARTHFRVAMGLSRKETAVRRGPVFALAVSFLAAVPHIGNAAPFTFEYEITGGESGLALSIGDVTGGGLTVSYPAMTCGRPCGGVELVSISLQGTTGTFVLGPTTLAGFSHPYSSGFRASRSSFAFWNFVTPISELTYYIAFRARRTAAAPLKDVMGSIGRWPETIQSTTGWINFSGQEVLVAPEPSSSALLLTSCLAAAGLALRGAWRVTR